MSTAPAIDPRNPPAVYIWTGPTGVEFKDVREPSGTYYQDTTPRAVINALESARVSGKRVRLFYGDAKTGANWCDQYNMCGTVGRSMGWLKTPLISKTERSMGGFAILTDCIVCLLVDGREVYRHPGFEMPTILIVNDGEAPRPWRAYISGTVHAAFETEAKATRWAGFMTGKRMTP